jgi:phage terminase small subunit
MPRKYTPKVRCKALHGACKRAAIRGGAVCASHGGQAPQVKQAAQERLRDEVLRLVDPDRALREAARLAYSDVRELYTDKGQLKPMKDWPDDLAAAIAGVEFVRRNVDGADGHSDDVIKVKVWDKPKALEMLFKNLGLYAAEKQEVTIKAYKWKS